MKMTRMMRMIGMDSGSGPRTLLLMMIVISVGQLRWTCLRGCHQWKDKKQICTPRFASMTKWANPTGKGDWQL